VTLADDEATSPDQRVRTAITTGEWVDLRTHDPSADDPSQGAHWGLDRIVHAQVLADLLTQADGRRRRALRLAGARITGRLDLEAAEVLCPVLLTGCWFEQPVNLAEAHVPALRLRGCHLPGFHADQVSTRGNLELNDGFVATGEVGLHGAHIGGRLDLTGATLTNPGGRALSAGRLTVDHSMFCFEGFTATGEVELGGAHIGGRLSFSGATLTNPEGFALFADGLTVDRDMLCSVGFTAHGEVSLRGAHIGGNLVLEQARLTNPCGRALSAASLVVEKGMFCTQGFSAEGEVRLRGAHIGRDLEFAGAKLRNRGGHALSAARLTVEQDMLCGTERPTEGAPRRFTAEGEVRLVGAHIKGTLDCEGAALTNRGGSALAADGLTVEQEVSCGQGFTAKGAVRLLRARIGGSLNFDTAALHNPDGHALYAPGLTVGHGMVCREGFTAHGEISLLGAHIGAQLDLSGATLTNPRGLALDLARLRATTVFLRWLPTPPERVNLIHAQVGVLTDDAASWPDQVSLRGFVYDTLDEQPPVSARQRLAWLGRDPGGYAPQPYEQLIAVYRRAGRDQDARTVAIAKQRVRRRTLPLAARAWSLLLDVLVGYGYRTWLAGVWLLGFVLAGWWIFDRAHPAYLVAPKPPGERPLFHAGLYALDLLLPIGDLNYQGAWIARGWARGFWLAWILAGWVLTTAVLAALAGILKRD
jgi:adhesin HecA-like repeat protein